jgi:hypothetical protein
MSRLVSNQASNCSRLTANTVVEGQVYHVIYLLSALIGPYMANETEAIFQQDRTTAKSHACCLVLILTRVSMPITVQQ